MKKISIMILFLLGISMFHGCTTSESRKNYAVSTNTTMKVNFNQEEYVWEQLYFPTNRVMDKR
jgi:hypothetical protein